MRRIKYLLFVVFAAGILSACIQPASADIKPLISEAELYAQMSMQNTVILDISPSETYDLEHIPGAINIKSSDIVNPQGVLPSMLLSPAQLQDLLSSCGMKNEDHIVIYGQTAYDATRLWWTLKFYGIEEVCILNGKLQTWKDLGFPVTTEIPRFDKSGYKLDPQTYLTKMNTYTDQVKANLGGNSWIIDARNDDEFSGRMLVSGAERRGRIPGAVNICWKDHLDSDGRFKSTDKLRDMYFQKGIINAKPVIIYCHNGFQSSLNYFVLTQILGYQNVSNYDASWIGWSREKFFSIECDYSRFIINSRDYELKGIQSRMDVAPYVKDERVYLPFRYIALALGINELDIKWDGTSSMVTIIKGSITVEISMEKKTIAVNGLEKPLDSLPEILSPGRIMLPARALVEAVGGNITWEKTTHQVWVYCREV